jgi:hypothetical protein
MSSFLDISYFIKCCLLLSLLVIHIYVVVLLHTSYFRKRILIHLHEAWHSWLCSWDHLTSKSISTCAALAGVIRAFPHFVFTMSKGAAIAVFTLAELIKVLAFHSFVIVGIDYSLTLSSSCVVVIEVLLVSFLGNGL